MRLTPTGLMEAVSNALEDASYLLPFTWLQKL